MKCRDDEARKAVERARKFQREASDLRRKLTGMTAGTNGSADPAAAAVDRHPAFARTSISSTAAANDKGRPGGEPLGGFDGSVGQSCVLT